LIFTKWYSVRFNPVHSYPYRRAERGCNSARLSKEVRRRGRTPLYIKRTQYIVLCQLFLHRPYLNRVKRFNDLALGFPILGQHPLGVNELHSTISVEHLEIDNHLTATWKVKRNLAQKKQNMTSLLCHAQSVVISGLFLAWEVVAVALTSNGLEFMPDHAKNPITS